MSEENKRKLGEQLIRCVLDDKLPTEVKLRKMDYIIRLGADINAECEFGCSILWLAKLIKNQEIVSFLKEKGAKDEGFDKERIETFFERASVEDINKFLAMLPEGTVLDCNVNLSGKTVRGKK